MFTLCLTYTLPFLYPFLQMSVPYLSPPTRSHPITFHVILYFSPIASLQHTFTTAPVASTCSQRPRRRHIQQIRRVEEHAFRQHMQPQQVQQLLVARRHRLRQRRREHESREHLHQVVVRGAQAQGQAAEGGDVLSRVWDTRCHYVSKGRRGDK